MKCREARKWMSPYLDSELGKTKTFEVSEHLRNCPDCAARFEAERNVDEMVRERLGATDARMPAGVWDRIGRDVTTPAWVRRLRETRTHMALAACLAVAVVGSALFLLPKAEASPPWIIGELAAAAPRNQPFPLTEAGTAEAAALLRDAFDLRITLDPDDPDANHHFAFHLVSAARRTDAIGREFLEVRLNCCGQPVLMVLAKPADGTFPELFDLPPSGEERYAARMEGVHVEALRMPGLTAIVASPHSVSHIMDGLTFVGV